MIFDRVANLVADANRHIPIYPHVEFHEQPDPTLTHPAFLNSRNPGHLKGAVPHLSANFR